MIKRHFQEVQKLDTIWPLAILACTLVANWILYFYLKHDDLNVFYGSMASAMLICSFLLSMRLFTKWDEKGVHYKFFPFHFKWKSIPQSEIKEVAVRKYKAWSEYGGFGIRNGKSGKALIISGDEGLQLTFKNGQKLLIGSSKADDLRQLI